MIFENYDNKQGLKGLHQRRKQQNVCSIANDHQSIMGHHIFAPKATENYRISIISRFRNKEKQLAHPDHKISKKLLKSRERNASTCVKRGKPWTRIGDTLDQLHRFQAR